MRLLPLGDGHADNIPKIFFRKALVGLAVLVSLLFTIPWDRSGTAGPAEPAYVVPTGVPSRMHAPLQDLHRAIEGHHS